MLLLKLAGNTEYVRRVWEIKNVKNNFIQIKNILFIKLRETKIFFRFFKISYSSVIKPYFIFQSTCDCKFVIYYFARGFLSASLYADDMNEWLSCEYLLQSDILKHLYNLFTRGTFSCLITTVARVLVAKDLFTFYFTFFTKIFFFVNQTFFCLWSW